jgi:hypothetical protein
MRFYSTAPAVLAAVRVLVLAGGVSVAASCSAGPPQLAPRLTPAGPDPRTSQIAPFAGHANHSLTQPTFRWGWFGAEHFYPRVQWHRDYNGDVVRWSTQRRY